VFIQQEKAGLHHDRHEHGQGRALSAGKKPDLVAETIFQAEADFYLSGRHPEPDVPQTG